ncbi:MAG: hypothetical protein ACI4MT_02275 [Christensenellales bacterium]
MIQLINQVKSIIEKAAMAASLLVDLFRSNPHPLCGKVSSSAKL